MSICDQYVRSISLACGDYVIKKTSISLVTRPRIYKYDIKEKVEFTSSISINHMVVSKARTCTPFS